MLKKITLRRVIVAVATTAIVGITFASTDASARRGGGGGFRSQPSSANASVPSRTSAGRPARLTDRGSGYADTVNACPSRAAARNDWCDHAVIQLGNWRGRYGLRRCCDR
jgi:hypothetical protein